MGSLLCHGSCGGGVTAGNAALRTLGDDNTIIIRTIKYIFGTTFYATIHSNLEQEKSIRKQGYKLVWHCNDDMGVTIPVVDAWVVNLYIELLLVHR